MRFLRVGFILALILCFSSLLAPFAYPAMKKAYRRGFRLHRVKRGETLSGIGKRYNVSWMRIAKINGIKKPYRIKAGSILKIPLSSRKSYRIYRVKKGDTLIRIAKLYKIPYREVARENGISYPYTIYRGERLRIPVKDRGKIRFSYKGAKKRSAFTRTFLLPIRPGRVRKRGINGGLDLDMKKGDVIHPSALGEVAYSSLNMRGFSSVLVLEHPGGYETVYAGDGIYWRVGEGEEVQNDTILGEALDNTVLHFEIRRKGKPLPVEKVIKNR